VTGTLILAAAPIGQPQDASARLRAALADTDVIAAEDTRRLRRLAADLDVQPTGRVLSFFEGNERQRQDELLQYLVDGQDVLVVTDAGMPTVSDPGYRLVAAAAASGVGVTVLPGPSAVLAALAVSGLPTDRFCFEGFLPRRTGERAKRLAALAAEERTMVFFEAPHRLAASLTDCVTAFGSQRPAVVCRELTKTHEEIVRGSLQDLAEWAEGEVRGEITLVIAGAEPGESGNAEAWAAAVARLTAAGMSRRDAVAEVARSTGASKRAVYAAALGDSARP
jgi:16S rRNA (cytidine1402-2'-O)-methyltransferase